MLALVMIGLCVVVDLVHEPAARAQAMMGWGSVSACNDAIAVPTQESAPEDLVLAPRSGHFSLGTHTHCDRRACTRQAVPWHASAFFAIQRTTSFRTRRHGRHNWRARLPCDARRLGPAPAAPPSGFER